MLAAILLGLAVKTPTVPFHTWLPPAHTDAPAIGSAVLAGVLLKMGTYGFVRIAMPMLPDAWRAWAWVVVAVGVVSVLYGALVALAQTDLKRMIAYTSVNHMGYVVLAVGAAGLVAGTDDAGPRSRGHRRGDPDGQPRADHRRAVPARRRAARPRRHLRHGRLRRARRGPRRASPPCSRSRAFASLGLPGFCGFIAEFQVFAGSIAAAPVTALALPGILITAALFLRALQRLLTGPTAGALRRVRRPARRRELWSVAPLLLLALLIGVLPAAAARRRSSRPPRSSSTWSGGEP